jgi:hypothetical protein
LADTEYWSYRSKRTVTVSTLASTIWVQIPFSLGVKGYGLVRHPQNVLDADFKWGGVQDRVTSITCGGIRSSEPDAGFRGDNHLNALSLSDDAEDCGKNEATCGFFHRGRYEAVEVGGQTAWIRYQMLNAFML